MARCINITCEDGITRHALTIGKYYSIDKEDYRYYDI